jgi:uncharacterized paraquat-inducible protein A
MRPPKRRISQNRYCSYCHSWVTKKAWIKTEGKCPRCHGPLTDPYLPYEVERAG